jgi:hypothetical protein
VLAFLRQADPPDRTVLVVINFGSAALDVHLTADPAVRPVSLVLGPHEFRILPD